MKKSLFPFGHLILVAVFIIPTNDAWARKTKKWTNPSIWELLQQKTPVNISSFLTPTCPSGHLDTTFSGDGIVETEFGGYTLASSGGRVVTDSDGKILTGRDGHIMSGGDYGFLVARYNPNGSLDSSFDIDGRTTTSFPGVNYVFLTDLAVQTDGKVLAGGWFFDDGGSGIVLVRYNSDGDLDSSFDDDGRVSHKLSESIGGNVGDVKLHIQADGNLLAATFFGTNHLALTRYNSTGGLDSTFGNEGVVDIIVLTSGYPHDLAFQTDGKMVVGGKSRPHLDDPDSYYLVRYHSDGNLDGTFGNDGAVELPSLAITSRLHLSIQDNGKIVTTEVRGDGNSIVLARYNSDGTPDPTLGGSGTASASFPSGDTLRASAIHSNEKIVVGGGRWLGIEGGRFTLARYNSDGTADSTFGDAGVAVTEIPPPLFSRSILVRNL